MAEKYDNKQEETKFEKQPITGEKINTSKSVELIFTGNRTFELHIGKQILRFSPRESKIVLKSIIEHIDFENVSKYFVVKEV